MEITKKKKPFMTRLKKALPYYLLLAPGIILLFLFNYMPIGGIIIAFKDFSPFKGVLGSPWAKMGGLYHFHYFLTNENFWRVMRNTIIINFYQLIFGFPFPIVFALLLNEINSNGYKKVIQTVSYLPHFLSWVVVASLVTNLLSPSEGMINAILVHVFNMEPIFFLTKPEYFRTVIVLSAMWKSFGMDSIYYIASLSGIDQSLYEAAAIDGAGRLKQTWHITLPGLRNIIVVLLVLRMGNMITIGFEQIFLLYNSMVYDVGDVISTYTYRLGIVNTQFSLTSAIGVTQSVVNFILVYSANLLSRKLAGWSLW